MVPKINWSIDGASINPLKNQQLTKKALLHRSAYRSSRPEVFCEIGIYNNLLEFLGKHLCGSLFSCRLPGLGSANLLKRDFSTCSFLRTLQKFKNAYFVEMPASSTSASFTVTNSFY